MTSLIHLLFVELIGMELLKITQVINVEVGINPQVAGLQCF